MLQMWMRAWFCPRPRPSARSFGEGLREVAATISWLRSQQTVAASSSNPSPNELADGRGLGQNHARIHIWSIAFASGDMRLINQQLQFASNFFAGEAVRNLLLNRHRCPITRVLSFCRNWPRHFRRARTFFLGIFEDAKPFKSSAPNEIEKAPKFLFRFPGKSDDESSAQRDAGYPSAQLMNQMFDVPARRFASHPVQH